MFPWDRWLLLLCGTPLHWFYLVDCVVKHRWAGAVNPFEAWLSSIKSSRSHFLRMTLKRVRGIKPRFLISIRFCVNTPITLSWFQFLSFLWINPNLICSPMYLLLALTSLTFINQILSCYYCNSILASLNGFLGFQFSVILYDLISC